MSPLLRKVIPLFAALAWFGSAPARAAPADLEARVLEEINLARTHPAEYARILEPDRGLARSAGGYAREQGPYGQTGHVGAGGDSLSDRMHRQQVWSMSAAETISYGYEDPRDVVRQLIVDDGVAGRGHRRVLFDGSLRFAGVGCGPHRVYGAMCVIDFSGPMIAR